MKCAAYRDNFGSEALHECDIAALTARDLPPARADLAWASFPCQDLSLAGARAGLSGRRSSTFHEFRRLMEELAGEQRAPKIIAIENVAGLLTSNGGADFSAVAGAVAAAGYTVSAIVIDARAFVPQSRPRLFVFGFAPEVAPAFSPSIPHHAPAALKRAVAALPDDIAAHWRWLAAAPNSGRNTTLADLIDPDTNEWSEEFGAALVAMMSASQRAALDAQCRSGERRIGAAFRRVRREDGRSVQRVEARFDGLAGCLRTPAGGSSRQLLLRVDGGAVAARWLSPREAARLMGAPDDYRIPNSRNAALKIFGDGVAPPVVRWIAEAIFEPALVSRADAA